jgi:hypothetical protein
MIIATSFLCTVYDLIFVLSTFDLNLDYALIWKSPADLLSR